MIICFIGYNDVRESRKISILNFCASFEDGICTIVGLSLHHVTLITNNFNALFKLFFSIEENFV